MAYTGKKLAAHAAKALGRHYLWGGVNKPLTQSYLDWLRSTYPDQITPERYQIAKGWIGEIVTDCAGLINSYYPGASTSAAKKVFALDRNNTAALPVGAVLYRPGHFGVYVGNGMEIDARGFDYGVVKRPVKDTAFTQYWLFDAFQYGGSGGSVWPWLLAVAGIILLTSKK